MNKQTEIGILIENQTSLQEKVKPTKKENKKTANIYIRCILIFLFLIVFMFVKIVEAIWYNYEEKF